MVSDMGAGGKNCNNRMLRFITKLLNAIAIK